MAPLPSLIHCASIGLIVIAPPIGSPVPPRKQIERKVMG